MEFIGSLISGIFIALVIGTALAFGFMILVWIIVAGIVLTLAIYLREVLRRWWFIRSNNAPSQPKPPEIIEGDYKDLTD